MLAIYYYNGGATVEDVFSDVKALLTGTTDVNLLSASCDKTNTQIFSSAYPADWQVAVDGTTSFILSRVYTDDPNNQKYVKIYDTGGGLKFNVAPVLNSTSTDLDTTKDPTHGTTTGFYDVAYDTTNGGGMVIYAHPAGIFISAFTSAGWSGTIYAGEYPRNPTLQPIGSEAAPLFAGHSRINSNQFYGCIYIDPNTGVLSYGSINAKCELVSAYGWLAWDAPALPKTGYNGVSIDVLITDIFFRYDDYLDRFPSHSMGSFTNLLDVYHCAGAGNLDEFTVNGNLYVAVPFDAAKLLLRKG